MSNKIQITESVVQLHLEKSGFKMLGKYKNTTTNMIIQCIMGHQFSRSWKNINRSGIKCFECDGKFPPSYSKKKITDHIDNSFAGFVLCENEDESITIRCPQLHVYTIQRKAFLTRKYKGKCKECEIEENLENHIARFENLIIEEGYIVLRYVEPKRALVKCHCNHEYEVKTDNFIYGRRCPECRSTELRSERQHSYNYVKSFIENEGYKILSKDYVNNAQYFEVMCPQGHVYETFFNNFQRGHRCRVCNGTEKHSYSHVQKTFKESGYKLVSTAYENADSPLELICNRGHKTMLSYSALKRGSMCKECSIEGRSGENHYRWKGGISNLHDFLREKINDWKLESMRATSFSCDITGAEGRGDLEVHHLDPFSKIVDEVLNETGIERKMNMSMYSDNEKEILINKVKQKHENTLGAPLLKNVHLLFHQTFGFHSNTPEQYYFFKENYKEILEGHLTADDYKQ